jgi:hypothetical protein
MLAGDVDIVFGPKGSGKSAIYATLLNRSDRLLDKRIVLVSAENPRGAPAFRDLVTNPPASEAEFVSLWKLFTLSLIGRALVKLEVRDEAAKRVQATLHDAGLLPGRLVTLRTIVRAAREYARRLMQAEALETTLNVDALTGLPTGVSARITLAEPSSRQRLAGSSPPTSSWSWPTRRCWTPASPSGSCSTGSTSRSPRAGSWRRAGCAPCSRSTST